ncbi:hypothetical protein ACIBG7_43175 [Nonomuraea sp. NPDC050328]|uniref:hypothetical protein n=1 Tax=Nonomuraea sp. NPDC050328 TaxID=3364361 RepID=UPI0037A7D9E3
MGSRARRMRTIGAWILLAASVIGWPLSALTVAKDEPQFVLGLSWLAITLTCVDLLTSSQVHEEQGEQQDGTSKR